MATSDRTDRSDPGFGCGAFSVALEACGDVLTLPAAVALESDADAGFPLSAGGLASDESSPKPPPVVLADRAYRIRIDLDRAASAAFPDGAPANWDPKAASVNVSVNGDQLFYDRTTLEDGTIVITPRGFGEDASGASECAGRAWPLFSSAAGFARLRIRVFCRGHVFVIETVPAAVMLPDGPAAQNLGRMARFVASAYDEFLSLEAAEGELLAADGAGTSTSSAEGEKHAQRNGEGAGSGGEGFGGTGPICDRTKAWAHLRSKKTDRSLEARLSVLEVILHRFEEELPYFRTNARFLLRTKTRIDSVERLQSPSAASAQYLASHPDEWMPADAAHGFRVGRRTMLPRHALSEVPARDFAIYENRVIIGFLEMLAGDLAGEAAGTERLSALLPPVAPEGYFSICTSLLSVTTPVVKRSSETLSKIEAKIRELLRHYRAALRTPGLAVAAIPKRTSVFREIAPYRRLFEAMARWFQLGGPLWGKMRTLLGFLSQSRLYEIYALLRLLEALRASGLVLASRTGFESPGKARAGIPAVDCANTFLFEHPTDRTVRVRVWYEPWIGLAGTPPENGMGLVRTTTLALDGNGSTALRQTRGSPFFTPDFVVAVERGEGPQQDPQDPLGSQKTLTKRWFVADAKYSNKRTTVLMRTVPLALRYLLSMGPAESAGRALGESEEGASAPASASCVEGLWLIYGKVESGAYMNRSGEAPLPDRYQNALMGQLVGACPDVHYQALDGAGTAEAGEESLVKAVLAAARLSK